MGLSYENELKLWCFGNPPKPHKKSLSFECTHDVSL
jgi:hypothetical protein